MPKSLITVSKEDYLKAILEAESEGRSVISATLAHWLSVSPPAVTMALRRLKKDGLVRVDKDGRVRLTAAGRQIAGRTAIRHHLIERMLAEVFGMEWTKVHDEAERLEHAVSEVLIERMAEALGNPRFDPHGDPIPDPDGAIAELAYTPLAEIPMGETVEIGRVDTSQPDRLRYLENSGLVPGTKVAISRRQPFRGPITVTAGGREQIIGHEIAMQVLCVRPGAR
jgi:DtxR family transcriptional regulator, iron-dependent repressor